MGQSPYVCLSVTCHLHFWQNDWGLLHATAVTQGWNGHWIRVSTQSWLWRRKFFHRFCQNSNLQPFDHEKNQAFFGHFNQQAILAAYVCSPNNTDTCTTLVGVCSALIAIYAAHCLHILLGTDKYMFSSDRCVFYTDKFTVTCSTLMQW